ncbi:MAG TPA: hypothetical protein VLV84_06020 [Candidatus Acidoferrales bacterium]|nr:hypothetical protein [Candidatus Acidoferrales bacterium]
MSQMTKRKITPKTKAGQYMCPECGKIFEDKKSVDTHIYGKHEPNLKSAWKLA